ncbi:MAG: glycosyltransferase [Sarcina sp.]
MISVIMPVYNGEKHIKVSIESIIKQTYQNLELLVIDDGSTDKTKEIVMNFEDNRIKYFYQSNSGQAVAKNLGIENAVGDYIAFIDSDDIYIEMKLELQKKYLEDNKNIGCVYTNIEVFEDNKGNYILSSEVEFSKREDFLASILFRQIVPNPIALMIKKESLGSIRFDKKYRYAEDYKFTIELAKQMSFGYLDKNLYLYRRHDSNVTNNHQKQVNAEISVIKELGINKIKEIVSKSNFSEKEKSVLLAKILLKINENEEAYKILRKIENKDAYNYFYMGNISFEEKRYIDAKCEYEKALNLDDSLAEVYNNLGVCEYMLGDKEVAKEKFLRAIAINSIYMDANYNLTAIENLKITKRELRKKLTKYNI